MWTRKTLESLEIDLEVLGCFISVITSLSSSCSSWTNTEAISFSVEWHFFSWWDLLLLLGKVLHLQFMNVVDYSITQRLFISWFLLYYILYLLQKVKYPKVEWLFSTITGLMGLVSLLGIV